MECPRFVAALYAFGYDGTVSTEHEDWAFQMDIALVKRGFLISGDVLRPHDSTARPSPCMEGQLTGPARWPLGAYCRPGRNLYP
jgi:hypothetical protein